MNHNTNDRLFESDSPIQDFQEPSGKLQSNNATPILKNLRMLAAAALMGATSIAGTGCNNSNVSDSADGGVNVVPTDQIGTAWYGGNPAIISKKADTDSGFDAGNKQYFELGQHDVLTADKVSKDYVSKITGCVDIVKYSSEAKNPSFYAEMNNTVQVILNIYSFNKHVYLNDAVSFIDANMSLLKTLKDKQPLNHNDFQKALSAYNDEEIYGPDGVLNLLLAFNRVISKLEPGTLKIMSGDYVRNQILRIDLQKRNTRSVTVEPIVPTIDEPFVPDTIPDIRNLENTPEKRVKPDGTFDVTYWEKDNAGNRNIVVSLNIDPKKKEVISTWYYRTAGPIMNKMTFVQYESLAKSPVGLWKFSH